MKKHALLVLAILLVPNLAHTQCDRVGTNLEWYGDPFVLPAGNIPIFAGQTLSWNTNEAGGCLAICITTPAGEFCGTMALDTETGWAYNEDFGPCWEFEDPADGCYYWWFDVAAPIDAIVGTVNIVYLITTYCDPVACELDPALATDTMIAYFEVVGPWPPLEIFQDTLTVVDWGVASVYVPFNICNSDPTADPRDYDYRITSLGLVGPAIDQTGTLTDIAGGDCGKVYGIIDASMAGVSDTDTLTIIGFYDTTGPGGIYDTCVQPIIVIPVMPVPLFTRPAVTIMALAMILAAAVITRRRTTDCV
jgi:hypothetical protein